MVLVPWVIIFFTLPPYRQKKKYSREGVKTFMVIWIKVYWAAFYIRAVHSVQYLQHLPADSSLALRKDNHSLAFVQLRAWVDSSCLPPSPKNFGDGGRPLPLSGYLLIAAAFFYRLLSPPTETFLSVNACSRRQF